MNDDDLKMLPLRALSEIMDEELTDKNCDLVIVPRKDPQFQLLTTDEKNELIGKI